LHGSAARLTTTGLGPRLTRLIAAAGVVVVFLVMLFAYRYVGPFDAETLADRVRASGPMGPLALIALLVAQAVVAPLPSPPILMAAGFVYGPWVGFGIGWLGLLLGAGCCFGLARAFGRPFAERLVRSQQLAAVDAHIAGRTAVTVLTIVSLRVFMPPLFDAVSYGCGLVRVPFGWFLLATALGEVPKVGSFTYIGAASGGASTWLTAWILLGPALGVIGIRLVRSRLAGKGATGAS
jgi:uncharacterized membrane protein YdjX (TVP38/TMEM64 family)